MLLLLWVKFHSVALALKDKYAFAFLKKLHLLFKKALVFSALCFVVGNLKSKIYWCFSIALDRRVLFHLLSSVRCSSYSSGNIFGKGINIVISLKWWMNCKRWTLHFSIRNLLLIFPWEKYGKIKEKSIFTFCHWFSSSTCSSWSMLKKGENK